MGVNTRAWALIGLLFPAPVSAQVGAVCGDQDLLFHCAFDNQKSLALCLSGTTINYTFGANINRPELSLERDFARVDYTPYSWASNTIFESVTLYNGDTSYEVFSTLPRGENMGAAEGGITVILPNQTPVTLTCDAGSVLPNDPIDGIGQLTRFTEGSGFALLSACLETTDDATSCIGAVQQVRVQDFGCTPGQDPGDCWGAEAEAWNLILQQREAIAYAAVTQTQGDAFAQDLRDAQTIWQKSRTLDCTLNGDLVFAADGGVALCLSRRAAARIGFLASVVATAEFDG